MRRKTIMLLSTLLLNSGYALLGINFKVRFLSESNIRKIAMLKKSFSKQGRLWFSTTKRNSKIEPNKTVQDIENDIKRRKAERDKKYIHEVFVEKDRPTYLRGWSLEETTILKQLLGVIPFGEWNEIQNFIKTKNKSQIVQKIYKMLELDSFKGLKKRFIKFQSRGLYTISTKALDDRNSLTDTIFNRDLRKIEVFNKKLEISTKWLNDNEQELKNITNKIIDPNIQEKVERRSEIAPIKELKENYYRIMLEGTVFDVFYIAKVSKD